MEPQNFTTYLLECEQNKKYAGSTPSWRVPIRFDEHQKGTGSKFTNLYKPVKILKTWDNLTSRQAMQKETELVMEILLSEGNLDAARGGDINFAIGSRWWINQNSPLAALL